jgi:hypothetical protein
MKASLLRLIPCFPTLLLYNISYGKVITHRKSIYKSFVFVKREKQKYYEWDERNGEK